MKKPHHERPLWRGGKIKFLFCFTLEHWQKRLVGWSINQAVFLWFVCYNRLANKTYASVWCEQDRKTLSLSYLAKYEQTYFNLDEMGKLVGKNLISEKACLMICNTSLFYSIAFFNKKNLKKFRNTDFQSLLLK